MTRIRPLAVLAALALSASLAVPGLAAAKPTITMSGSTTVAPLAALLAKKYLSSCGHCVNFKLLQGGSDVGISDVASGRVTIGNASRDPEALRPRRPRLQQDRPRRHLHRHPQVEPAAGPRPGRRAGDLRRQRPHLEPGSGVERQRHDRRLRPHPRLRYPGRLPEDLPGLHQGLRRRPRKTEQRPHPALGQERPERDRLRLALLHAGRLRGPLQGRRLHRAQRQVRPVRRPAQPLHGHPRRRPRARPRNGSSGSRKSSAAAADRSTPSGSRSSK